MTLINLFLRENQSKFRVVHRHFPNVTERGRCVRDSWGLHTFVLALVIRHRYSASIFLTHQFELEQLCEKKRVRDDI
jgi:hypothetical protein